MIRIPIPMDEEEAEKSVVFTTEIKVTRRRRFKSGGYLSFNKAAVLKCYVSRHF